jgi:fructose-1-phosphate kinase PfkB-like protein
MHAWTNPRSVSAQKKHSDIEEIAQGIRESLNAQYLIVTMGKRRSLGINHEGKVNKTPIFSTRVVDTIGAGDAFFGNAVGALAVQTVCNKRAVEKVELLEFINTLVK